MSTIFERRHQRRMKRFKYDDDETDHENLELPSTEEDPSPKNLIVIEDDEDDNEPATENEPIVIEPYNNVLAPSPDSTSNFAVPDFGNILDLAVSDANPDAIPDFELKCRSLWRWSNSYKKWVRKSYASMVRLYYDNGNTGAQITVH